MDISDEVLELVEKKEKHIAKQQTYAADRKHFSRLSREIRQKLKRDKNKQLDGTAMQRSRRGVRDKQNESSMQQGKTT